MSSYKIKDLGVVITGYTPKTSEHLNYSSNDYMFISPTDLKKSRYIKSTTKYVSSYAFNNSKNRILKFGDIVVDCIGSDMGNVGFVYDDCISNQQINAITSIDNNKVLNLYLYYLLSTKKNYFHQIGMNGSTMPIVSKSLFEDIDISIHELDEQQHIVNIIGSIDDLIENLNLINLEFHKLGISIIRKNVNGNERNSKISDISNISSGKSTKKNTSGKYQIIGANGCLGYTDNFNINEKIIITGRVGTIGTFCQYDEAIWCSDNTLIIRTKYFNYLFYYLNVFFDSSSLNRGSTQPLITQTDLLNYEIFIPENIVEIENQLEAIYSKIKSNNKKICILKEIKENYLKKFFG